MENINKNLPLLTTIIGFGILLFSIFTFITGAKTELNARIDRVETRIGKRIDHIETRIDRVETRIDRVETRIGRLEDKIDQLILMQVQKNAHQQEGRPPVLKPKNRANPTRKPAGTQP